ncbi:DUF6198 family protein [Alkalihalobacillus sp. LMS6]|uniref:YczE/YyaS/YitT family protein n=2 Tax=Bacillales TaxID=1385 RepID=UPI0020D05399|nr:MULTISPECIES: DUF6198 family protein [Bacillaceae]UTR06191.1 DUF6198 family protein [Alkalihalobacillus sp. LMS6]
MQSFNRYALFSFGLFFMGIGIALTTRSELGTSPISSVPYVLSLSLPLSIGTFTFLLLAFFVLVQKVILGSTFPPLHYLQLLIAPLLGLFIDFGMFITAFIHPSFYLEKLSLVIIGCLFLALGVTLQIEAKTIMNAGEAIVKVLADRLNKPFSSVKVSFDWGLVGVGILLSFISFGGLVGIREGTILSAFLVGFFIKLLRKGLFAGKSRKKATNPSN